LRKFLKKIDMDEIYRRLSRDEIPWNIEEPQALSDHLHCISLELSAKMTALILFPHTHTS
jgi:hypothetical protein